MSAKSVLHRSHSMYHIITWQIIGFCYLCSSSLTSVKCPALCQKFRSRCSVNRTIHATSAPNGITDNFAILKNCFPKGIPIIVIQHIRPATAFPTAIGIPIIEMHHKQPTKTHDSPLNNPPHINQSIFPNMPISIFLLYLFHVCHSCTVHQ